MALVDFAPLRIPLHRRLETAAVALYYYSFFFGALIGTLIILGLFFTSYYPIAIFYLTWAYLIDGKTPEHGGRRSNFMRKLRIWKYFRDYFPITLIKTAELDPSKNYVFGYHPHGILCAGAFCNFATEATDFSSVFPGITPHLLPLMGKTMLIIIIRLSLDNAILVTLVCSCVFDSRIHISDRTIHEFVIMLVSFFLCTRMRERSTRNLSESEHGLELENET